MASLSICAFFLLLLLADASSLLDSALKLTTQPDVNSWMRGIRGHLHTIPELQFQEHETHAYIRARLQELGIRNITTMAKTGIVAVIDPSPGSKFSLPWIALRADMDALPIDEPEQEGASKNPGTMHACGHDAHMTMVLGAARVLQSLSEAGQLKGRVSLIFQPAEEGMGGAKIMIDEGALVGVDVVSGIHVWPSLPSGTLASKAGPIMAASDRFSFVVVGRGGHAAIPHLAIDPVVATSAIVLALQALISRETSPTDSAVISVTRINTGEGASNVIPSEVTVKGTLRALTKDTNDRLHERIEKVVVQTGLVYGCNVSSFSWSKSPYPPTINDAVMVQIASDVVGLSFELLSEPSMAAEDFSYYGQAVPSVFAFLGIGDKAKGTDFGLHNPQFRMDDDVLSLGAAYHAAMALSWLDRNKTSNKQGRDEL